MTRVKNHFLRGVMNKLGYKESKTFGIKNKQKKIVQKQGDLQQV